MSSGRIWLRQSRAMGDFSSNCLNQARTPTALVTECSMIFHRCSYLAVATGVKLANHELTVLVAGGDGDGFGIGGNHFLHTRRRNVDLLYVVRANKIYGLTRGQPPPRSRVGMRTKSMPFGNIE